MRIISGKYKGKKIEGFDIKGTRPTMDRIKESLFGIIQNDLENSVCLDLFAGSGSLGIEALSNGASMCYFVDNNKEILNILSSNLESIKNSILIKDDYLKALEKLKTVKFDIIFLDPPYQANLINPSLKYIIDNNMLNKDGLVICEYEKEDIICTLNLIKEKKYGSKKVKIFKNNF